MEPFNQEKPVPLSKEERAFYQAEAEKGKTPSLSIVRRFIATIRLSITSSPSKTEKTKVSRNVKPKVSEDDFTAF